ncbi:glycoside hydrolase [Phakopsora pachyrhizi]|uniref:alpha-1,2-Mannosidase n=1 Tax=Phakopsora pachyrhizi TaxID=170000 RepID=A0AAV0AXE9_PHAPC|nr:glycoside hydrolase [Phakopsora pachyrhizi]
MMKKFNLALVSWIFILPLLGFGTQDSQIFKSSTSALKIQADHFKSVPDAAARARTIRQTFKNGFNSYKKYAWGHDEVGALTLNGSDSRNGWGATIVDSLTTLQLMGLVEEFSEALDHIKKIDFSNTTSEVSLFESTIRYIGGMISAYEASARSQRILLRKSIELADRLMFAWKNDSALPFGYLNFTDNSVVLVDGMKTNLAEAGSLVLEFYKLSKNSHNSTYLEMAESSMKAIMDSPSPWPGLHPTFLDPISAKPVEVTWGAGSDSYYEYLNKFSLMTGNQNPRYLKEWELAVDSSIKHLIRAAASTTATCPLSYFSDKLYSEKRIYMSSYDSILNRTSYTMSHLDCFVGGNFMLGGKMLQNQTIVSYGLKLVETCADSYSSSRSSVGSEIFGFVDKITRKVSLANEIDLNQYDKTGFFHLGGYILRPEVIESMFYAYRITGDSKWQELAWKAFLAIKSCCEVSESTGLFSTLRVADRVPTRNFQKSRELLNSETRRGEYGNKIESFWWAETLKYLYLIFSDPWTVSLDEFVFTTEGHPIRIEEAWIEPKPSPKLIQSFSQPVFGVADWVKLGSMVCTILLMYGLWKRLKMLKMKLKISANPNLNMMHFNTVISVPSSVEYEFVPSNEPDDPSLQKSLEKQ